MWCPYLFPAFRLGAANVGPLDIAPGSPWENGYAESFHSQLWDEFLECEVFKTVHDAQALGTAWRQPLRGRGFKHCLCSRACQPKFAVLREAVPEPTIPEPSIR